MCSLILYTVDNSYYSGGGGGGYMAGGSPFSGTASPGGAPVSTTTIQHLRLLILDIAQRN